MVFDTVKVAKFFLKTYGYHIDNTPKIRCTIMLLQFVK